MTADDEPRTVELTVPEMDCPSCAGKVENALGDVAGIAKVDLRPTSGTAIVTYDPSTTTERAIADAIEGAGYDVETDVDGVQFRDPTAVWRTRRAIGVWVGAVFLVAGLAVQFLVPGADAHIATIGLADFSAADALYLVAVATGGIPIVRDAYYSVLNRSLDIDLLMGGAIVAATATGHVVEAATLAVLYSTAELLERYAMDRTRDSLRELVELSPEEATVRRNGEERSIPADEVAVGDAVIVRAGDRIPIDGVVREGTSAVDESAVTGESVPADKGPSDEVFAGSIAEGGYLEVEATATADDSTLARIVDLVREAQAGKTEKEQFIDRFAGYYTPIVVALALITVVVPPLVIDGTATVSVAGYTYATPGDWGTWFVRGLALLVIACPCALVISTPVSIASGITAAARNGVLIKGGTHLEATGDVDAVAFDKTGTLTKGELAATDVFPLGDADREGVLTIAAALEERSEHPIAEAILERARDVGVDTPEVEGFETVPGKGVRGEIDGTTYFVGKPGLFAERGIDLSHLHAMADGGERIGNADSRSSGEQRSPGGERTDGSRGSSDHRSDGGVIPARTGASADCDRADCVDVRSETVADLQAQGKTVVLVGTDQRLMGAIGIADELRSGAERSVRRLHELGVDRVVMLTGDNEGTARAVAEQVGVDEYRADLLPEEKVDAVRELEAEYEGDGGGRGGGVAMVGDGINDAPSLAAATVGIAMGAAGTDTAIETADVALMGDDLAGVPYTYALAGKANAVIRENVWGSLAVKAVLAVGAPLGYVTIAMAVLVGDMGMSLGVTGNAMRLSRLTPDDVME